MPLLGSACSTSCEPVGPLTVSPAAVLTRMAMIEAFVELYSSHPLLSPTPSLPLPLFHSPHAEGLPGDAAREAAIHPPL